MKLLFSKTALINRNGIEQTLNFPVDLIDKVLKEDKKRPFIGLREPLMVGAVMDSSANNKVLLPKDIIQSMGGVETKYSDQVIAYLDANKNKTVQAIVLRLKMAVRISTITTAT